MTHPPTTPEPSAAGTAPSARMVIFLAASCGIIVGNIYYAQPLVGLIAPAVGLGRGTASLIVTLTQLGYAVGLLALVPLGDIIENRRLLTLSVLASIPALLFAGFAHSGAVFLAAAALIGVTSVAVQMLVPLAAHLAPDHLRGRIVGNVMSGLVIGILLARPIASLIADYLGWRAVFFCSAGVMALLAVAMRGLLPVRRPGLPHGYFGLLRSLIALPFDLPLLRHRALYHAAVFGTFSMFWTAAPLLLTQDFGLSQRGLAVFALVGAAGAFAAPIAGRLADRDLGQAGTIVAICLVIAAFLIAAWGGLAGHSIFILAGAGVLLDAGVQANLVFSQRVIYAIAPEMRSRLNGVFMAACFAGGAIGSALVSPILIRFGWLGICCIGVVFPALALLHFAINGIQDRKCPA